MMVANSPVQLEIPPPPLWLRTRPKDGGEDGAEDSDTETRERQRDDRLYCAACRAWVTREAWRIAIADSHAHTFTNPAGFTFDIGCFTEAPGARGAGPATDEFTWFAGYRWRIAVCAGCGAHLGWVFAGAGEPSAFHGLILDRLVAEGPGGGPEDDEDD